VLINLDKKNKFKIVKTPGNRHKAIYMKKKHSPIKCGISKLKLKGLSNPNSLKFVNICKRKKVKQCQVKKERISPMHVAENLYTDSVQE